MGERVTLSSNRLRHWRMGEAQVLYFISAHGDGIKIPLEEEMLEECYVCGVDESLLWKRILQHEADKLTHIEIDMAVEAAPAEALRRLGGKMTSLQIEVAAKKAPEAALEYVLDRLDEKMFEKTVRNVPSQALMFARDRLNDKQLSRAVRVVPPLALELVGLRMSEEDFRYCASKAPHAAFDFARSRTELLGLNAMELFSGLEHTIPVSGFLDPSIEARRKHLMERLSCPVCETQTLKEVTSRNRYDEADIHIVGESIVTRCVGCGGEHTVTLQFKMIGVG